MSAPIEKLSGAQWDGVSALASDEAHTELYELIAEEASEAPAQRDDELVGEQEEAA